MHPCTRHLNALVAALAVLVPLVGAAAAQDAESIVYIKCEGPDGKTSRGSGVIVSDRGRVLTAKHVAPTTEYQCRGVLGTAADEPTRRLLRRRASPDYDALLLEFVPNANERFRSVFAVELEPELQGSEIAAYGFPAMGTGQVSVRTGAISTTIPNEQGMIETDALTARGMSGGPVFLKGSRNALVGIVAGASFDPGTGFATDFAVLAAELVADDFDLLASPDGPAAPGGVPPADDLRTLAGSWSGEAVESGGFSFTVEMQVQPECAMNAPCGTIAVPHVPCRGRLTLIAQSPDGYEFGVDQFDSSSDVNICTPGGGEVVKLLPDGTLSYTATYSGARGILRRD